MSKKLRMTLSLDLDNKWSYLKTHGSDQWKDFPSYFDTVVPRIIEFLAKRNLKITFFIVGQDAALEKNRDALQQLVAAGHEIANHSFNHEPWLHLYSKEQIEAEMEMAENAIEAATGVKVKGFRGPGFSLSTSTLEVLHGRNYDYDATAFPNVLNPLARAYFFANSNLTAEQKKQRKALFGTFSDAYRPVKPYRWELDSGELLELPVTTMPLFKIPIHFSYLVYLAKFSSPLARLYTRVAISMCRMTKTEPSLLLHPLDFMGIEDNTGLEFFPAMQMKTDKKLALMNGFFDLLQQHFTPMTMGEYIDDIRQTPTLKKYKPVFAHDVADSPSLKNATPE